MKHLALQCIQSIKYTINRDVTRATEADQEMAHGNPCQRSCAMMHSIYLCIARDGARLALGSGPGLRLLTAADLKRCPRFELHLFDNPSSTAAFASGVLRMPPGERPLVKAEPWYFDATRTHGALVVWPRAGWDTPPDSLGEVLRDHRHGPRKPVRLNDVIYGEGESIARPAWMPPEEPEDDVQDSPPPPGDPRDAMAGELVPMEAGSAGTKRKPPAAKKGVRRPVAKGTAKPPQQPSLI